MKFTQWLHSIATRVKLWEKTKQKGALKFEHSNSCSQFDQWATENHWLWGDYTDKYTSVLTVCQLHHFPHQHNTAFNLSIKNTNCSLLTHTLMCFSLYSPKNIRTIKQACVHTSVTRLLNSVFLTWCQFYLCHSQALQYIFLCWCRILVMQKREDEDGCWVPPKASWTSEQKFKYCKKVLTRKEAGVET